MISIKPKCQGHLPMSLYAVHKIWIKHKIFCISQSISIRHHFTIKGHISEISVGTKCEKLFSQNSCVIFFTEARTYYKEMFSDFSFSRIYWYNKNSRIRQSSLNGNIELGRETGLEANLQNVPYIRTNDGMCGVWLTYNICYHIYTISYYSL